MLKWFGRDTHGVEESLLNLSAPRVPSESH